MACAELKAKVVQINMIAILERMITEVALVEETVGMITGLVVRRHREEATTPALAAEVETITILHQEIVVGLVRLMDEEKATATGIEVQVRELVRRSRMPNCKFRDAAREMCLMFK